MIRIQYEPYDLSIEINRIKAVSKSIGALTIFEGIARDFSNDHNVDRLDFECYIEMAENELRKIEKQAKSKFDIIELSIIHRIGTIDIGEGIVLILAVASHRAAAYEASRWCIDEIKRSVPIWKKECLSIGDIWVTAHP